MTISKVFFASRGLAESLPGCPFTAVVSITDPGMPDAILAPLFQSILRISFYDAVPADEFLPSPIPGMFDHEMAQTIGDFVEALHNAPEDVSVMVHCEYGVSRSTAVALFIEAHCSAALKAREFAYEANQWVVDRFQQIYPELSIDIPLQSAAHERRELARNI